MLRSLLLLTLLVLTAPWAPVLAHETPIALLTLKEVRPAEYRTTWAFQSARGLATPRAVFPEHCMQQEDTVRCGEQGLSGRISVERLGKRFSGAVIRIIGLDGSLRSYTLTAAQPSLMLTADGVIGWAQVASAYVPLGFEHIVLGVDHLLFVLGLLWLVSGPWMLVKTITAFTVAHSLTLAAATLGWVGVPEPAVNACIALSIVFVAVDVLKKQRGQSGLTVRYPWLVAFVFGLLHGFGFAGALTSLGLPQENIPAALLFFNVGVELGQLAFVFLVLALVRAHGVLRAQPPHWSAPLPAYAMGSLAMFWFYGRFLEIVLGRAS